MHNSIRVRLETSIQLADYFFSRAAALSRSATVLSFSRARSLAPAIHPPVVGAWRTRGWREGAEGRVARGEHAGGPHTRSFARAGLKGETRFLLLAPISLLSPAIFLRAPSLPPSRSPSCTSTPPAATPRRARALARARAPPSPPVLLLYFNQLILRNAYIYCALSDGGIHPPPGPSRRFPPSPPDPDSIPIPPPLPAARVADQPAF